MSQAAERFFRSMRIDYGKWHDGVGYDLKALEAASPEEKEAIQALLIARDPPDWRDLEALARLDTPAARKALQAAMRHSSPEVRSAALAHAGDLASDGERLLVIRRGLEEATISGGLTDLLNAIEDFHPPEVIELLLKWVLRREGQVAVHLAAICFMAHGLSDEQFAMAERPLFLLFAEAGQPAREAAFRQLCARIGRDPEPFLRAWAAEK